MPSANPRSSMSMGRSVALKPHATMVAFLLAISASCSPPSDDGPGTGGTGGGSGGSTTGGRGGSGGGSGGSTTGGRGGSGGAPGGSGGVQAGSGGSPGGSGGAPGGSGGSPGGSGGAPGGSGGSPGGSGGAPGGSGGSQGGSGGSGTGGASGGSGGMGGGGGGPTVEMPVCTEAPAATPPALKATTRITGFAGQAGQVVGVPGEDTLYVIGHRNGNIYTVMGGQTQATPLLNVSVSTGPGNEQGLLGMALHPDFANNKLFYIYYTPAGMAQNRVEEWQRMSITTAMKKQDIYTGRGSGRYHNGGSIYFNPKDTTRTWLYHSVGNAETGEAGNPAGVLGRVLRYDVATKMGAPAPGGNFGQYTWVYGLRNPYRMTIDRGTGDMYIGDVANGPGGTIIYNAHNKGGTDFGYRANNGSPDVNNGLTRETGGAAIIGGVVYRGKKIPGICGRYFFGVHSANSVKSLVVQGGQRQGAVVTHTSITGNISSFGEDGEGEIWISSMNGNAIHKLEAM
jgi:hypothetical protein